MMTLARDLARIRMVTERYHELQGLGRMGIGAGLLTGASIWAEIPGETLPVAVAILVALAIGGTAEWGSRRLYYEPRFGRVAAAAGKRSWFESPVGMIYGGVAGVSMAAGYPNVMFVAGALVVVVRLAQDWRSRPYLAIDVASALAAAALYGTQRHALPVDRYFSQAFALVGASAIVTGLCDHLLLVRTLRPAGGVAQDEEPHHADTL